MQIKRFEGADMTEALRLVKREFGDEAVILSAKEIRSGGFFSSLKKKSVEITAATDYPLDDAADKDEFSGLLSEQLDTDSEIDRVSLSSVAGPIQSPVQEKRSAAHAPTAPEPSPVASQQYADTPLQGVTPDVVNPEPQTPDRGEAPKCAMETTLAAADEPARVVRPFYRDLSRRKIIALVGAPGVGKSTTLAKLALHCRQGEGKRVALISLDRFRIGANHTLASIAGIMDLSLNIARDQEELRSTLDCLINVDVILIDTPGIAPTDASMIAEVKELLKVANPDETHLVVNATVRENVLAVMADNFSAIGVDRLLLTHMDEHVETEKPLDLMQGLGLLSSFYADGVDLFDGLQETTVEKIGGFSATAASVAGRVSLFDEARWQHQRGTTDGDKARQSVQYVVNRNSELFHHPDCKSVKQISTENITAFNCMEQAVAQGFKPCQACCDTRMTTTPVTRTFGYRRASAN